MSGYQIGSPHPPVIPAEAPFPFVPTKPCSNSGHIKDAMKGADDSGGLPLTPGLSWEV